MTTVSASSCEASESTHLTDGFHVVVDALKANDIDTIYRVVGIPITDLARIAQGSGIRYIGFRPETSAGNAAAAAAVETGKPVVAIEDDNSFGFSGMEIETICRYRLPVTVIIPDNGGVYRGDEAPTGNDPAPTVLNARARHERIAEAFGGKGYHVTTRSELHSAPVEALASNGPSIIDCELDPAAGWKADIWRASTRPVQPHRRRLRSAPMRDSQ